MSYFLDLSSRVGACGHFYGKNSATGYFHLELLRSPLGTAYSDISRYLSVSVKVSRRIGGRKKSHAFRIQINAREMHQHLLNDFVTCDLVTD